MATTFEMPEIAAAIGRAQLTRLDELVERAELIANALTRGITGLRGITPPKVRDGCRHNYFMWSCKIDESVVGVSRSAFCKALAAEGVPLAEGYVRPIYQLPMFQKRIAMGRNGFPFSLSDVTYANGMVPCG